MRWMISEQVIRRQSADDVSFDKIKIEIIHLQQTIALTAARSSPASWRSRTASKSRRPPRRGDHPALPVAQARRVTSLQGYL